MNILDAILVEIGEPYHLDDGNYFCWAVDVTLNTWGHVKQKTLYYTNLTQAESLRKGDKIRE